MDALMAINKSNGVAETAPQPQANIATNSTNETVQQ